MEGGENCKQNMEVNIPYTVSSNNLDCRINCTDIQSLRTILDKILHEIPELANSLNASDRCDLITCFSNSFKNALQKNIMLNGLPVRLDKSSKLSSFEKEDHTHMVDDEMFSNLTKAVSNVAQKRKFFPEQCCRILNLEMEHDLQNLKKAKVVNSSASSVPSSENISRLKQGHMRKFSEFCKTLKLVQANIRCTIQDMEKLKMDVSLVSHLKKKEKTKIRYKCYSEINSMAHDQPDVYETNDLPEAEQGNLSMADAIMEKEAKVSIKRTLPKKSASMKEKGNLHK